MKPHYNVLIATPGKVLHAEYVESLVETTKWLNEQGLSYKFLNKQGSLIPSTRELTALDSYDHNWETREVGSGNYTYDKIFWIDSDVEWTVESFKTLYESELDIVAGLYQTSPEGRVAIAFFDQDQRPQLVNEVDFMMYEPEEPIEVYGAGFGFLAIKQGVFEKCDRPWFLMERIKWPHLDFETNVGEDYSFCVNARRNGFKVYVLPKVKVRHHKETVYEIR